LFNSPFISDDEKNNLLNNVFKDIDEDFLHFLFVLIKNQRFNLIEEIKDEFEKLYHENKNVVFVHVTSMEKLSKKQEDIIRKDLEKKYPDANLKIENEIDPDIIGGIKIIVNDESIDLSLRNYLSKLKESI
jgi:F-type H+-transporting ATPase subunit delta